MPKFNNSENQAFILHPPGDYVFRVSKMESGLQTAGKTIGSQAWKFTLAIEGKGGSLQEKLIDHPSCSWKIDTFIKCCGVKLAIGEAFDFDEEAAHAAGCTWVNSIGLRGWCHLQVEEYTTEGGEKRKKNKVAVFYTDKPKLPREESHDQPEPTRPSPPAAPAVEADGDDCPF